MRAPFVILMSAVALAPSVPAHSANCDRSFNTGLRFGDAYRHGRDRRRSARQRVSAKAHKASENSAKIRADQFEKKITRTERDQLNVS